MFSSAKKSFLVFIGFAVVLAAGDYRLGAGSSPAAPEVVGFIYNGSQFSRFIVPGVGPGIPRGINDNGDVVAVFPHRNECFVVSMGHVSTFNVPGGRGCGALGINQGGSVVGQYMFKEGYEGTSFVKVGAKIATLNNPNCAVIDAEGINDSNQIVGSCTPRGTTNTVGFLLSQDGSLKFLSAPGASATYARGIDGKGQVVGFFYTLDYLRKGSFAFSNGVFRTLDNPACAQLEARGVSNKGRIVGYCEVPNRPTTIGFVLDTVTSTFETFEAPGTEATLPDGINDKGQVVGTWVGK